MRGYVINCNKIRSFYYKMLVGSKKRVIFVPNKKTIICKMIIQNTQNLVVVSVILLVKKR